MRKTLALLMIITACTIPAIGAPSDWAKDTVVALGVAQILPDSLSSDSGFQKPITREQFAELSVNFYARAKGISPDSIQGENPFSDTRNPMAARAFALGIIKGTGPGQFSPSATVTREQLATMLQRQIQVMGKSTAQSGASAFADDRQISSWAKEAMYFCRSAGILSGVGNNLAAPKNPTTVEQALVLIHKTGLKYGWIASAQTVSKTYQMNGFTLPQDQDTELEFYQMLYKKVVLNISSGAVIPKDRIIQIQQQQQQIYDVLVSNSAISHAAALTAAEQASESWDPVNWRYEMSGVQYITPGSGAKSLQPPSSGLYLKVYARGSFNIEVVDPAVIISPEEGGADQ